MLRKIRIVAAIICFALITLLFLDFTGTIHAWFGCLAKIQLLPAVLALNVGVVVGLLLLTLIFGRVYCSVICPMGVFQDIVSWFSRKRKKNRFAYSPAKKWLRLGVLAVFVVLMLLGLNSIAILVAPYSAYGRIASNLFAPVYQLLNNLLAYFAERVDSYAFYSVDVWMKSLPTFIIAVVTLVVIVILAWRSGRTYCNTICPVGTVLGFVSKYSIFKPVFDVEKCNGCKLCARNCKASCINPEEHKIDYSRCVVCMDCLENCKQHAISYKARKCVKPAQGSTETNKARRSFLTISALFASTAVLKAQEKSVDGGLAVIEDKKIPQRAVSPKPAGSKSVKNFSQHCTACQLCVSACPNQVLRPSSSLLTLMQPEMSYERGYCRPECTRCSEVCPAGAITPITAAEKSSIQIGHAVWIANNCVVNTDRVFCGNCARHCPVGAILMVPKDANNPNSLKIPAIDTERCIGCGACENLCPARPFSAIYVEGHEVHKFN